MIEVIDGNEYSVEEAHINDVDLSLMSTDMSEFQKSVFSSSVKLKSKSVVNPSLKVYLALMPVVMRVNGFGGEEGND